MGKHKSSDYKLSADQYYLDMDEPSFRKKKRVKYFSVQKIV